MTITLKHDEKFISGHLLSGISFGTKYKVDRSHANWIAITDDCGKRVHLSKTMQRKFLVILP